MMTGLSKLQEEYKYIRKSGILATIGGSAGPINKYNYFHWSGCFIGPKNSPYMNGLFYLEMKFPNDYPNKPPYDVQMRTPTYHPNIWNMNGHICVSYLSSWKMDHNIVGIINSVFDLLADENPGNGYHVHDKQKATDYKNIYATESQNIDWNNSWDKGWDE
jgi:ubiquitin-protein ligase